MTIKFDTAYGQKYIIRLPDGTPVRMDKYETRLALK